MKRLLLIGTTLSAAIVITSCYYDKEQLLYPDTASGPCTDTSMDVSYSQKVVPIFKQYCYGCHGSNFPSGNIQMGTYATDKVIAQNGKLYGSVSRLSGYSPMPQSGGKLSKCQLTIIKRWIDAGMLNN